MFYNANYGKETINKEYKVVTFKHSGVPFDEKFIEELIRSSNWVFNENINKTIKAYTEIYLPKYIASFMDPNSEAEQGELYFGIDDNGIIQGIPYQGEIDKDLLTVNVNNIIDRFIISNDNNIIKNSISIELIKLDYEPTELPHSNEYLEKYYQVLNDYNEKEKKFQVEFTEWYEKFNKYIQKLIDLFNLEPTRNEIHEYIKLNHPSSPIIKMMENGLMLVPKNHDEINELKNNPDNAYYWVCKWKDVVIDIMKSNKPIPKHRADIPPAFFSPASIISNIPVMIPWWVQNNMDMILYVIKFTINKNSNINEISYYDSFGKINKCYRTSVLGAPCCVPVKI